MELNDYQKKALETAVYPKNQEVIYTALGLGNEAGEVLGKIKKWIRGDDGAGEMSEERRLALRDEIGDVLWYVAGLAGSLGFELEAIAQSNIAKLSARKEKGTIMGDGDKR